MNTSKHFYGFVNSENNIRVGTIMVILLLWRLRYNSSRIQPSPSISGTSTLRVGVGEIPHLGVRKAKPDNSPHESVLHNVTMVSLDMPS